MIKNIVLDVGRVLVAWEPLETMRKLGFSEEVVQILAEALFESGVWHETDRGVLTDEEFLALAITKAPAYETEIRIFWEHVGQAIWQLPYAKAWIHAIKEAGCRVYILSNYGSHTYEQTKETALDFLSETDGAIFSYEVKQIKPDAAIYSSLLERFSLKPEECVFFDDLPANIEGAKRMGMHGFVFTGLETALEDLKTLGVALSVKR